jgi:hypothetical protein
VSLVVIVVAMAAATLASVARLRRDDAGAVSSGARDEAARSAD